MKQGPISKDTVWNNLKWIKEQQREDRIFLGTKAIITEKEEGVYDIMYGQTWMKSDKEQYTELLAVGFMNFDRERVIRDYGR